MIDLIKVPQIFKTSEIHFTKIHLTKALGKISYSGVCPSYAHYNLQSPYSLNSVLIILRDAMMLPT